MWVYVSTVYLCVVWVCVCACEHLKKSVWVWVCIWAQVHCWYSRTLVAKPSQAALELAVSSFSIPGSGALAHPVEQEPWSCPFHLLLLHIRMLKNCNEAWKSGFFDEETPRGVRYFYCSNCGNGGHRCPPMNSLYKELKSHNCLCRVILRHYG